MTKPSSSPSSHIPNDFGSDLWIKNEQRRHATAGRGLFAGLQDVKHYNVDHGWAKRSADESSSGILGMLSRLLWGSYRPPTN